MKRVFFLFNQNPLDGSAHAIYCMRHVLALAEAAPSGSSVTVLHASFHSASAICAHFRLPHPQNFRTITLPHLRRGKRGIGLHANGVFHVSAGWYLRKFAQANDVVATASFPRLFESVARALRKKTSCPQLLYEVHQLESLSHPPTHKKVLQEMRALALADRMVTTCGPLLQLLSDAFPAIPTVSLGLGVGYGAVVPDPPDGIFRLGYFGSLSEEQGVPWLVSHWPEISRSLPPRSECHIYGRARRGEQIPPAVAGVFFHEPIPASEVPYACRKLSALIIPALDIKHRAQIAFTKAYDYTGLALPIIAADLPTIREVLRPEQEALLYPPGNATVLASQLARLIGDEGLSAQLQSNLRHRAADFTWANRARQWWKFATE